MPIIIGVIEYITIAEVRLSSPKKSFVLGLAGIMLNKTIDATPKDIPNRKQKKANNYNPLLFIFPSIFKVNKRSVIKTVNHILNKKSIVNKLFAIRRLAFIRGLA